MKIEMLKIKDLVPYIHNPKDHPKKQIEKIKRSIEEFGFNLPVLIDKENGIIAGYAMRLAAMDLGMDELPCVRIEHLTPGQVRAFRIADNKVAESGWLPENLQIEFKDLAAIEYDLELTGFDTHEIDELLRSLEKEKGLTDPDEIPDFPKQPISKPGTVWDLGSHRLLCGDATNKYHVKKLMAGDIAEMVFTDPPYNVNYEGKTGEKKTIKNDNLADEAFYNLLYQSFRNMFLYTCRGGAIYICHSDGEWKNFRSAMIDSGWLLKQCLIWLKNQFVLGRQDYHWCHEPILYGWKPGAPHNWCGDRKQSTFIDLEDYLTVTEGADSATLAFTVGAQSLVLKVPEYEVVYSGNDSLTSIWRVNKPLKNEDHPTIKPTALIEKAVYNSSKRGGIVLDLFGGAGSTLIACEMAGRASRIMELDPVYCDVIVNRWEDFVGKKAVMNHN